MKKVKFVGESHTSIMFFFSKNFALVKGKVVPVLNELSTTP
jgi:hypothetical protein